MPFYGSYSIFFTWHGMQQKTIIKARRHGRHCEVFCFMEIVSMFSEIPGENGEILRLCYKLLETRIPGGSTYGILCYESGREGRAYAESGLFDDEELGEYILSRLAAGAVFPEHIREILADSFSA